MRPAILSTLAALSGLGLTQPEFPGLVTPVDIIESAVTQSLALLGPANQLSALNAPLVLIGAGPWAVRTLLRLPETVANKQTVITGFTDIVETLIEATSALPPTGGQFTGSDALAITDAFHSFSAAQAGLLGPVTQAASVVAMIPIVGTQVSEVLVDLMVSVDVSWYLSTPVQGRRNDGLRCCVKVLVDSLTGSLGGAGAGSIVTDMGPLSQALDAALAAFS